MKHKIEVVMLPTIDITSIIKGKRNKLYHSDSIPNFTYNKTLSPLDWSYQHIYITVSQDVEPIEEGSYCIEDIGGVVFGPCEEGDIIENGRRVIASTDPELKLPQVQQSFLKEFVANPNGEWEVEYIKYRNSEDIFETVCTNKSIDEVGTYKIKLNQDNTVNITSVEEKMYSREEVIEVLSSYREYIRESSWVGGYENQESFNNWIKENL